MWGTDLVGENKPAPPRFIPTHVGNGIRAASLGRPPSVHPHACGERRPESPVRRGDHGSSPRMWGTDLLRAERHPEGRFIPTHVGNGPYWEAGKVQYPVHPHACGER